MKLPTALALATVVPLAGSQRTASAGLTSISIVSSTNHNSREA